MLERFSKILDKDLLVKKNIASVIESQTRASLQPQNFSLKDGVLEINASAAAKNEINLKEEQIKEELARSHHIFVSRILYK